MTADAYTEKLHAHYVPLLQRHGSSCRAVDWGSEHSQTLRLAVCTEVGDLKRRSILDVGCGVGHLAGYLKKQSFDGDYVGVDILPEMIATARSCHPGWEFHVGDLLCLDNRWMADYVIASGVFTFCGDEQVKHGIRAMFELCRVGMAFNALSKWGVGSEPNEFRAEPIDMLKFCRALSQRIVLRHDYLEHDFTVYLYK